MTASELYVMGNGHELDKDLLSAYFDGALVGSSLQEAERLVATDQAAADYLDSLKGIRQSLKNLPAVKLPQDFAQTVLARARAEADRIGLPANHPVRCSKSGSVNLGATSRESSPTLIPSELDRSTQPTERRSGWGMFVGLATAAAILALVVFRAKDEQAPQQTLLSQLDRANEAASDAASQADGQSPMAPADNSSLDSQLAQIDPSSQGKPLSSDELPKDTVAVSRGAGALEALRNDLRAEESNAAIDMLMVVDTVLSEQAWREDRFGELLKRAGITNVKPILVDNEVQAALEETRMTAPLQADSVAEIPSAAIVFLRARGKTIDAVIKDMFTERADFRQTSFDLAMDKPFNMLHKSLRKLAKQTDGDQPTACVLTSTKHGQDDSSPFSPEFVAGRRKAQASNFNASLVDPGGAGLGQQLNPIVELLVVLRQESASSK